MASVQAAEDRDTTDEEIAARESIPVGHTGIVVTSSKLTGGNLSRVRVVCVVPFSDICGTTLGLRRSLPGLLARDIRSAVLVGRNENGWCDLLTMHND